MLGCEKNERMIDLESMNQCYESYFKPVKKYLLNLAKEYRVVSLILVVGEDSERGYKRHTAS